MKKTILLTLLLKIKAPLSKSAFKNNSLFLKVLLCLILFITIQDLMAQDASFEWAKKFGTNSGNKTKGSKIHTMHYMSLDELGNVITIGTFNDTVVCDPAKGIKNLISKGRSDIFISKLDRSGNFKWAIRIGGKDDDILISMVLDVKKNIYLFGSFDDSADLDPGKGAYYLPEGQIILKLDSSGNFLWAQHFDFEMLPTSMQVDKKQNLNIVGFFFGTVDFNPGSAYNYLTSGGRHDIFILKLNQSGNFLWVKQFEGTNAGESYVSSMVLDSSSNLFIAGTFEFRVDFDPGKSTFYLSPSKSGYFENFIANIDSSGNLIWVKQAGSATKLYINNLSLDAAANLYCTGSFSDTVDFDLGNGFANLFTSGIKDWDIFISKLDKSGKLIWVKSMGGKFVDGGVSLKVNKLGEVYSVGFFEDSADFNPGKSKYYLSVKKKQDLFISKLNSSGNFIWAMQLNVDTLFSDLHSLAAIEINKSGKLIVFGNFNGKIDFNPGKDTFYLSTKGMLDIFICSLNECNNKNSSSVIYDTACTVYRLNGQTYMSSNIYTQFLKNHLGCDSIITLYLTVKKHSTFSLTVASCDNYTLNSTTYTKSGVYKQILSNKIGCDSTITLTLSIKNSAQTIDVNSCKPFFINNQTYSKSGVYIQTLTNQAGCDSILTINLTIESKKTYGTITDTSCTFFIINSKTYLTTGIYTQILDNKADCDSILTLNLTINQSPKADFSFGNACTKTPVQFTFTGEKPLNPITSIFKWNFNNEQSSSAENPTIQFISAGSKIISLFLTSSNGCTDVFKKTLMVKTQSKADFETEGVCEMDSTVFKNISLDANEYLWKFGDGTKSTFHSPKHWFKINGVTQTFNVALVAYVKDGCSDSIIRAVTINSNPKSDFNYFRTGTKLVLKATNTDGTIYHWTFGTTDSVTTSNVNYTHTLKSPDQNNVCLKVTNLADCISKTCKNVTLSIGSISKHSVIKVYPNPSFGHIILSIENPSQEFSIEIYDLIGNLIKTVDTYREKTTYSIQLNVAEGIYIVKVNQGSKVWNQKVLFFNSGKSIDR